MLERTKSKTAAGGLASVKNKFIGVFLVCVGACGPSLFAQYFPTLLGTGEGSHPYGALALEGSILFGVTSTNGTHGDGNVFQVNWDGSGFADLYDFTNQPNVTSARSGLVLSGTTLYGTGNKGGNASGYGAVFAISTSGAGYTNLHVFTGGTDGSNPLGGIVVSSNVVYGTTEYEPAGVGYGTVYAVNTDSTGFNTLFTFSGTNGALPNGNLLLAGNLLYGTTYQGGASNLGTVFSLTLDGKTFSLLHSFSNTDGTLPTSGLILNGSTLYGTASSGGAGGHNYGTVFSLGANGSNFTVLHNFSGSNSIDGNTPKASLVLLSNVLYGTTSGAVTNAGTIFSVSTNGTNFNLLYIFSGGSDGKDPEGPMVFYGDSLYGTTVGGGDGAGDGTIFRMQLFGVLIAFQPAPETNLPSGANNPSFYYSGVSLDGIPNLQYQWRLNGVNIPGQTGYELQYTNVVATNGGLVTIAVSDGIAAPNSFVAALSVNIPTTVYTNDYFTNRFSLGSASSGLVGSSNTNATRETGEPVILTGNSGGKSIWFKWTAPSSGIVVFSTTGSAFDTIMGVYTGTSVSALTREPSAISDDDSGGYLTSKISFNAASGQEYEIVVDGYSGASGSVVLSWQMPGGGTPLPVILTAPPPLTVTSNGGSVTLVCIPNTGIPSWYFNGQATGITGTNNVINSVTATNVGYWVAQVSTAGGTVSTQPSRIEISALQDGTTDTNSQALNKFLNSVSDSYAQPSLGGFRPADGGDTHGYSVSQVFSTVGSTGEAGELNIDGQIGGSPVWYTYITPTNGTLVINTAGSSFNTLLGIYTGPGNSFATLTAIGQGYTTNRAMNGQPQIVLTNVPAKQTNYIAVDGYQGATGTVDLNILLGKPVTITTPPSNQLAVVGSNATFSVTASGSTPLNYFWMHAGTNLPGATNGTLTITNVQSTNTGTYTVLVSNLVSMASNSATLTTGTIPAITTQPVSHTIPTNTTATLTVAANGNPTPGIQWYFNGATTGAGVSPLSIPNFTTSNQGYYWAVASNGLGTATSSNAELMLNSPYQLGTATLSGGTFQLQLIGISGTNYILQATTNFSNWFSLTTNTSASGFIIFADTNATNFKGRFYRAITN